MKSLTLFYATCTKKLKFFSPNISGRSFTILLVLACICERLSAQKLPTIQEKSIFAPSTIKIDGKIDDWHNQFSAYNNSTSIFYSMANDADHVYVVIHASDPLIEKKTLKGGITISIKGADKYKNWLKITFPLLDAADASNIGFYLSETNLRIINQSGSKKSDSLLNLMNWSLSNSIKKIGVTGSFLLLDSVISVYNDKGIKAAALFDNKAGLTYEFAIPLKYLPGNPKNGIDYNIKLNGIFSHVKIVMLDPNASPNGAMVEIGSSITGKSTADIQALNSDTDLSGKYQLASAP